MGTNSLSLLAEDYFFNMNSLARRIGDDVEATKDAYEGLWNTLSLSERNQAIDETIIQPEVALKYTLSTGVVDSSSKNLPEWYPKLRIQTGLKYMIDETGSTLRWKDEHSGPFSFMTQSQMNLSLLGYTENPKSENYDEGSPQFASPIKTEENFDDSLTDYSPSSNQTNFYQSESYSDSVFKNSDYNRLIPSTNNDNSGSGGNIFTKLINKTSLLKITTTPDDDMDNLVTQKNTTKRICEKSSNSGNNKSQTNIINLTNVRPKFGEINESTALLDSSSSYSSFQSSLTTQDDGIPKTGFEFLDNW